MKHLLALAAVVAALVALAAMSAPAFAGGTCNSPKSSPSPFGCFVSTGHGSVAAGGGGSSGGGGGGSVTFTNTNGTSFATCQGGGGPNGYPDGRIFFIYCFI